MTLIWSLLLVTMTSVFPFATKLHSPDLLEFTSLAGLQPATYELQARGLIYKQVRTAPR